MASSKGATKQSSSNKEVFNVDEYGLNAFTESAPPHRIRGFLRSWYLYNNMTPEDILSDSESSKIRKAYLNNKFLDEFKLPTVPKDLSEDELNAMSAEEQAQYKAEQKKKAAERSSKLESNFQRYAMIYESVNKKLTFKMPDLSQDINADKLFSDLAYMRLAGQTNINLSQAFSKDIPEIFPVMNTGDIKAANSMGYSMITGAMSVASDALTDLFASDRFVNPSAEFVGTKNINKSRLLGLYTLSSSDCPDMSEIMGKRIIDISKNAINAAGNLMDGQLYDASSIQNDADVFDSLAWNKKLAPTKSQYWEHGDKMTLKAENELHPFVMAHAGSHSFLQEITGKELSFIGVNLTKQLDESNIYINGIPLTSAVINNIGISLDSEEEIYRSFREINANQNDAKNTKRFEDEAARLIKDALDFNSKNAVFIKDKDSKFTPLVMPYPVDKTLSERNKLRLDEAYENKIARDKALAPLYEWTSNHNSSLNVKASELDSLSSNDLIAKATGIDLSKCDSVAAFRSFASKIYVNGVSALNYYQIPYEADISEYRVLADKLAASLKSPGECVMTGDGTTFKPVSVEFDLKEPAKVERFSKARRAFSRQSTIDANTKAADEYEENKRLYDQKKAAIENKNKLAAKAAKDLSSTMRGITHGTSVSSMTLDEIISEQQMQKGRSNFAKLKTTQPVKSAPTANKEKSAGK